MRILLDHVGPITSAYSEVRWNDLPLGPPEDWDHTLRITLDLVLRSKFPMTLLWGPESVLLYNDAYVELIGDKHPYALGRPAQEIFPEVWDQVAPLIDQVMDSGEAIYIPDAVMPLRRRGFLEECYFKFSYSPVRDEEGHVKGVLDTVTETTTEVVYRRRMSTLGRLALGLPVADGVDSVARTTLTLLRSEGDDFAAVDIVADDRQELPLEFGQWSGQPIRVAIPTTAPPLMALMVMPAATVVVDDEYRSFLGLVTAAIGQVLGRAYADEVQRRMSAVQREMSEEFQRSLLPRQDQFSEPQIAVRYRPAMEVAQLGGDWYDFFELPAGGLGVVIGDVAGHDQRAAATMAQLRNLVRGVALSTTDDSPASVLTSLERVLHLSSADALATAVLARVKPQADGTLEVTWSNAGHPPPLLLAADGNVRLLFTEPDLMLGLDPTAPRSEHRVVLEKGATLLLYTDGLVESRKQPLEAGLDRLLSKLVGAHDHPLEALCDEMLATAPGSEDDVALLLLRA